ncbi:hypothetical protein TNCT_635941 [Trichonephila clavata]|uniref:Uncharacterized protein n=1 Tax=Trichonephila clavata TaxID=2740835 RepID=A0A8X6H9N0_TRICU|nr:hypothetical protein TNCT_635941 [Trichonephila clavata]
MTFLSLRHLELAEGGYQGYNYEWRQFEKGMYGLLKGPFCPISLEKDQRKSWLSYREFDENEFKIQGACTILNLDLVQELDSENYPILVLIEYY